MASRAITSTLEDKLAIVCPWWLFKLIPWWKPVSWNSTSMEESPFSTSLDRTIPISFQHMYLKIKNSNHISIRKRNL